MVSPAKPPVVNFETVTQTALNLPAVEPTTCYGTPALKAGGRLMARLREDGRTLVLRADWLQRERLIATQPEVFFLTEHYRAYPWVLVRLAKLDAQQLPRLLEHAWLQSAPRAQVAAYLATRT
jgi:hypothetical protein